MKHRWVGALFLVFVLFAGIYSPVKADGIIIPEPLPCPGGDCPLPMQQLTIRYHHVTVTIEDQIATTHIDQVFVNPNEWTVEGTYIFPLPQDAAVSHFTLWVDGEPVEGKVLDRDQARQMYEAIVREMRDPALLEYMDRGAVQARIFPIPPQGERRIELEYQQVLTAENGLVRYSYPLNTEKFSAEPLESVKVSVEVRSSTPVRAVYSPSHTIDVSRQGEMAFTASYEAANVRPDTDFALYYSLGESQAFHLFSYRDPQDPTDPDGFFLLLLAPQPGGTAQQVSKDVLLVLDRSGSMEGEKFQQAQAALRYILQHLNPGDRFYLETFSSNLAAYANGLRPAEEAGQAIAWVNQLGAAGSTDINRALLDAASVTDAERPTYLIFLTDGLPTEGVTAPDAIIVNFQQAAPNHLRLFAFGVGYDVDTFLLDSLAQEHHGLSTYVRPGEALDEILSSFYERISTPVLTDVSIDFGDLAVYDVYPQPLPDLFAGSQVVVVGRYRRGGAAALTVSGQANGEWQEFRYPDQLFTQDSREATDALDNLPRLWATRKIGYLLNQIRLSGADPETVDQIVRLSIRYGIVTPYTSYLVTEPMPLGATNQQELAQEAYEQMQAMATAPASGQAAVERAAEQGALSQADVAPAAPADSQSVVRTVGSRTFVLKDEVWVDTQYDPEQMQAQPVPFLSPAYFELADRREDVAAALALGERVILVVDGSAYEVVPAEVSEASSGAPVVPAAAENPGGAGESSPGSNSPRSTLCASGLLPLLAFLLRRLF